MVEVLDKIAEYCLLIEQEIECKSESNPQLAHLLREEELKWYKGSSSQFILEGDSNTRYFQSVANGRHQKKLIYSLHQDERIIEGHE
jgi:hypothetical protein